MLGSVVLAGVTKQYGRLLTVQDVSLNVEAGHVVSIIGPSGAGKTTLLRLMAGLESPDAGSVQITGRVGMVAQAADLWPHKRAVDNVAEPLALIGKKTAQDALQTAYAALEKLGIGPMAHALPETLSGGEAQRVAIARTLALEPDVVLLDEVTSALDAERTREIMTQLVFLAREEGRTLFWVTHDLHLAAGVSDHVVFLEGGCVVEQGPPDQVFSRPQAARTQAFVQARLK